jgi:transcriptional regulator with XRE-family HTH domain
MATRKTPKKRKTAPTPKSARSRKAALPGAGTPALIEVARQLRSWTDSVLGVAGAAADVTVGAARLLLPRPGQRRALEKTGAVLRRLREAAGMSIAEVGAAIDLSDPGLLALVESGKIALPFEVVLRLAAVLGRNDPISFVMRFTRAYNPEVWQTLETLGIGRLALQAGREREFANIYRASDAARGLSDAEFAVVLAFVRAAFEMAMTFRAARGATREQTRRA